MVVSDQTIIKESACILGITDHPGFPKTMGAPLLGEAPLIGRIRYFYFLPVFEW